MAQSVEVTSVVRNGRHTPHDRIRCIGGLNADGTHWRLSQRDAIGGMESGIWDFYVVDAGCPIPLVVAWSPLGTKYLKSLADEGHEPATLLRLPDEVESPSAVAAGATLEEP